MKDEEINQILKDVFKRIFKRDIPLNHQLTAKDVPGWDSLRHILLMTEIEKTFQFRFTTQEILDLKNVGELLLTIKRKKNV